MNEVQSSNTKTTKKKTWIKFYPERWLFGSTREEMTNAERAVWFDFLALAALNDPPRQFEFISRRRLANQLNISIKLLNSTIDKATTYGKIEIKETHIGQVKDKTKRKKDITSTQHVANGINLASTQSKIGLTLHIAKILTWAKYQSDYMRQKPHREAKKVYHEYKGNRVTELHESDLRSVTEVTDRGEEQRGEEDKKERKEKKREDPGTY